MARIRTIKPSHVNDKQLATVSLQAHLFWILSWCFSDDDGVLENDPLLLKSTLFPRRTDIRVEQVQQWIDQLVKARFMIPFTYDGDGYLLHRTFKIHQKIDRPQPSKIPSEIIQRLLDEHSTNDQPCNVGESKVKESSVERDERVEYFDISPFQKKINEWIGYRKQAKRTLTQKTRDRLPKYVLELAGGSEETAMKIIDQSINNGWQGLFPLKENSNGKSTNNRNERLDEIDRLAFAIQSVSKQG